MKVGILEIEMLANLSRLSDDMRRAERLVGDSMGKVEKSVAHAKQAMASLGMGLSIGLIADQMRRTADTFVKLDAQIRNSTKSQQQYNQALADIRRISTIAQADISATTMLYTRLLNTTDGMGISQGKLATVTETVVFGLKAYGATSAEAASAALQLSQAMGANRLGGEEFRAAMEAMPNVMKVLAKSMGVPLGELRALSIAGKITTAEMVKAFGDPAVAAEFKRMAEGAQTITGAWTVARNELILLFGEFAKSSGLTQGMIASINGLAGAFRAVGQYLYDIIALLSAWAALRVTQMVYGYVTALMASRAAALAVAEAELTRVNMTYGASAATVAAARTSYAYAAANTTLGGSLMILGQRMMAFVSANAAAIAIVSLGAAAVALKRDFDNAIDSVTKFQEKIRGMEVDALRAARQLEVANVAAMKSSIFSGFNERDILFAERRIRMMDAQILAAEKLAKIEAAPTTSGGKGVAKPILDRTTILERMANEMRGMNEAELSGRLSNVEKVGIAWANLNDQQKKDAKYLADYEAALAQARIADWRRVRDAIADNITQGIMSGAKAEDVLKNMVKQMVLEPQVKLAVTAGVDWVKAVVANTVATEANTAASSSSNAASAGSSGSYWAIVIAIVAMFLDRMLGGRDKWVSGTRIVGSASRQGFEGQLARTVETTSGLVFDVFGRLSTKQLNMLNSATADITETYARAGDILGYANIRTKDFTATIDAADNVVGALSDSIGMSLVPAFALFQREGETLQQTAERLTETFKATNDFIVALGVSQGAAFGGFGLGGVAGRDALIAASGGLQAFTQNAQGFIRNFLTPAQQLQPALDAVGRTFSRLGIQGVSTNEQFAALVKQQMELGNTDVVAQLLSVADSLNAVTKSAADANKELQALLRKELFGTLVDYIRATNAGVGAAGSIAAATAAARSVTAQESAAAAALAGQTPAAGTTPAWDTATSGWMWLEQLIRDAIAMLTSINGIVDATKQLTASFVEIARGMWADFLRLIELLPNPPDMQAINNALTQFPGTLTDVKNAFTWMLPPMTDVRVAFGMLRRPLESVGKAFEVLAPSMVDVRNAFDLLMQPLRDLKNLIESLPNPPGVGGGGGGGFPMPPSFGLWSANGNAFGRGGHYAFANGGAFTNNIYSSPTPFMFANGGGFSQGVMGEAGDEAVMPLKRGPDGRLGVSMHGSNGTVEEIRLLREEVRMLRSDNQAGQIAIATSTQRTYKVLDRWNGEGLPPERIAG